MIVGLFNHHVVDHADGHSGQRRIRKSQLSAAKHERRASWFPRGHTLFFFATDVVALLSPQSSRIWGSTS